MKYLIILILLVNTFFVGCRRHHRFGRFFAKPRRHKKVIKVVPKRAPRTKLQKLENRWVGKKIRLHFKKGWEKPLKNLTVVVKIIGVERNSKNLYLLRTKNPYTRKGHDYVYVSWLKSDKVSYTVLN